MPPVSPLPSASEADSTCSTATSIELVLITVSIIISLFLYALPVKVSSKMYEKGRRPLFFSFIFILLALLAGAVSLATIILGHKRFISLDAIAAVVFALIPGLVSFPRDAFIDACVFISMHYFRVYPIQYRSFRYITIGHPCKLGLECASNGNSVEPTPRDTPLTSSFPECATTQCNTNVYIRYLPHRRFLFSPTPFSARSIHKNEHESSSKGCNHKITCRWEAEVIEHTKSVVVLRNLYFVPEQKWFLTLSRSLWFVMQPWIVHLNAPGQVAQALRLVSDIIALGRLVLHYRGDYVKKELKEMKVFEDCLSRSAANVCNAIMKEMGLTEWSEIDMWRIRSFQEATTFHGQEGVTYNVLFFFLVVKSKLFGEWFEWKRGPEEREFLPTSPSRGESVSPITLRNATTSLPRGQSANLAEQTDSTGSASEAGNLAPHGRAKLRQKIRERKRFVSMSALFRWIGFLINGTTPFRDPNEVTAFRYGIRSTTILREIQNSTSQGADFEKLLRDRIDDWLKQWGCNMPSST